jgi:hypothetical protein
VRVCDGSRSGGGIGRLGLRAGIPVALALLAVLTACGPRADQTVGGGVNLGAKPAIIDRFSHINDPDWTIDGDQVTFAIPFHVQAQDTDANMRFVDINVFYVETCGNTDQEVELLFDLDPSDWARTDINVDGETVDEVRVPTACYPDQNLFNVQLRVRDSRGNLSNTLVNAVQVGAGQGTGGGTT